MAATNVQKDVKYLSTGRRRSCLGCLGRGAIVVVILLVLVIAAGLIYQTKASATDMKKYPVPGELYDVGDYRLHLYCTGEGSPTVILEAGAGLPALSWNLVQKEVAGFTRVCSYDRAGFGWSESAPEPLSPHDVATDLHKLLLTAGIPGPYILVGHSAGGLYVRAYADQYPAEVTGMVLVDAVREQQNRYYPPEYVKLSSQSNTIMSLCRVTAPFGFVRALKMLNALAPANVFPADIGGAILSTIYRTPYCTAVANEVKAVSTFHNQPDLSRNLGDLPLIVLSAGITAEEKYAQLGKTMQSIYSRDMFDQVYEADQLMQRELVSLSTQGKPIIAMKSGHFIQYDQPELVIDAIHTVIGLVTIK